MKTYATGTNKALKLSATIKIGTGDIGYVGQVFILASMYDKIFLLDSSNNWVPYTGGPVASYMTGSLSDLTNIVFLNGQDVSSLAGLVLYAGYGVSAEEMLAKGRFKPFYMIVSDGN